jgi:hypothetical protein
LIPFPSPIIFFKYAIKKTPHLTDYSLNRTAANQIVPAKKKLCVEECRRVNSDGALGRMIPQIIILGYIDYAVSTKNGLQLAKHVVRKLDGGATMSNFVRHLKLHKER